MWVSPHPSAYYFLPHIYVDFMHSKVSPTMVCKFEQRLVVAIVLERFEKKKNLNVSINVLEDVRPCLVSWKT